MTTAMLDSVLRETAQEVADDEQHFTHTSVSGTDVLRRWLDDRNLLFRVMPLILVRYRSAVFAADGRRPRALAAEPVEVAEMTRSPLLQRLFRSR